MPFDESHPLPQDLPVACTLSTSGLRERLAEMAALSRDALLDQRVDGARARLRFAARPGVRGRVEAIAAAESSCCAFLTLRVAEDRDAVVLSADAPEGAEPALGEWVAAFGAGAHP